jgi:hypothetical protein
MPNGINFILHPSSFRLPLTRSLPLAVPFFWNPAVGRGV